MQTSNPTPTHRNKLEKGEKNLKRENHLEGGVPSIKTT